LAAGRFHVPDDVVPGEVAEIVVPAGPADGVPGVDPDPVFLPDERPVNVQKVLDRAAINVEYMYAFTFRRAGASERDVSRLGTPDKAMLVFRFEDPDAAIRALQAGGINVVASAEVFAGLER
jgi:hypothetical protein